MTHFEQMYREYIMKYLSQEQQPIRKITINDDRPFDIYTSEVFKNSKQKIESKKDIFFTDRQGFEM